MNNNYILLYNELTQFIEFKHRSLKHTVTVVKVKVRQQKEIQYCVRAGMDNRTGQPGPRAHELSRGGPKQERLCEVAVINFACCQLFLDFVFVNIRSGFNVSLICGWKRCILLHVLTHGFIIRPCVRVHNNNTLQHETLNHSKQYTFADLNKMLFVITRGYFNN